MRRLAFVCVFAFLAACSTIEMDVPDGFLRLSSIESGDLRAVTADDARIWARDFDLPEETELAFWSDAVANDLRDARGYTLEDRGTIHDGAAREGRLFEGGVTVDGQEHGYLLAVWMLAEDRIRTVEFTAPRAKFDANVAAVRDAIATLR